MGDPDSVMGCLEWVPATDEREGPGVGGERRKGDEKRQFGSIVRSRSRVRQQEGRKWVAKKFYVSLRQCAFPS
jgi:hypothetical protein